MTSSYVPSSRVQSDSYDYYREQKAAGDRAVLESLDDDEEYKKQQQAKAAELEAQDAAAAEEQNKKTVDAAAELSPPNPLQEVGTAVIGAGIDAVESVGATAESALTGQMNNPDFKPTWLQVADEKEPMNRTMWGNVLRGVGEYGLLAATVNRIAKGAKAARVPGANRLSQALSRDAAKTTAGKVGRDAIKGTLTGAAADFVGSYSSSDTITTELNKMFPNWVPDYLVTDEDDSPLERKVKNVVEGAGLGAVTDIAFGATAAWWKARQAAKKLPTPQIEALEKAEKNLTKVQEQIVAKTNAVLQTTGGTKLTPDQNAFLKETDPEWVGLLEARKTFQKEYNEVYNNLDPKAIGELKAADSAKRREANFNEKVDDALENDLDGLEPNPWVNSPLYDLPDTALLSPSGKGGYYKSLVNAYRMETDGVLKNGRRPSVYTEAALEKRLSQFDPERRKIIERVAKDLEIELNTAKSVEGKLNVMGGYNVEQLKALSTARYLDLLDDVIRSPEDLGVLKAAIEESDNYLKRGDPLTGEQRFMGLIDHRAVEMLVHTTAGEISDLAQAGRSIDGVLDNGRQIEALTNRLEFMLMETGRSKYVRGFELNGLKRDPAEFVAGLHKKEVEVKQFTQNLREMFDNDPEMVRHWLDVMAMADGNVKAFDEMYKFAKDQVFNWKSLVAGKKSAFVDALQSVMINSMLSGPKTLVRATVGTGMITFLRPLQATLGGVVTADPKAVALGLAMTRTSFEAIGESLKVMRMAWNAGAQNLEKIPYLAQQRVPMTMTDQWKNIGGVIEKTGTVQDKMLYKLTTTLYDFNNFIGVKYPMVAFGAIDAGTNVVMGRMDAKMLAFSKAWDETGGKNMGDLVKKYEDEFRNQVFDHSKQMVKSEYATHMADEAGLKLALSEFRLGEKLAQFESFVSDVPLLRASFMFMKTGWNALELIGKHTPILAHFNKEVKAVLSATPDDLTKVALYGINNPIQLLEAQATMRGRIATGYMTVAAAIGAYMSGTLTGNGPSDRETRNAWIQSGWRPRSIKVGDKWVSYDSLEPFTSFLSMVADIGDNSNQLGEPATQNMFTKLGYMLAMNVTNKSFLQGLNPLTEILTAPFDVSRSGVWVANIANNHLPWGGIRNELANIFNPGMRELDNDFQKAIQTVMNRNPGLKDELPLKYDILDGSVVREFEPWVRVFNAVMPIQINFTDNPTRRMLRDSGYDIVKTLSTDSQGNKLDARTRSRLQNLMGKQNIEAKLEKLFSRADVRREMEMYKKMRDLGIRNTDAKSGGSAEYGIDIKNAKYYNMIEKVFNDAKRVAEAQLHQEYPDLRHKAVDRRASKYQQEQGNPNQALQRILSNKNK